jgi:hypothetical protein
MAFSILFVLHTSWLVLLGGSVLNIPGDSGDLVTSGHRFISDSFSDITRNADDGNFQ